MRTLAAFLSLALTAPAAFAGSIGIYTQSNCTGSALAVAPGDVITLYVAARTDPPEPWADGVVAAEYRIIGLPLNWAVLSATPGPQTQITVGDAFGDGIVVAFAPCQRGCLILQTLRILATVPVQDHALQIVRHVHPTPPYGYPTDCAWLWYNCDAPSEPPATCAETHDLILNPTVAATPRTWSNIKRLYD